MLKIKGRCGPSNEMTNVSVRRRYVTSGLFVSAILCASSATAKEREPLDEPLECPIDAPVRVASGDTLKHFKGLLQNCQASDVIISPAERANVPSYYDTAQPAGDFDYDPRLYVIPDRQTSGLIAASQTKRGKANPVNQMQARAARSADGSYIAIVPPESLIVDEDELALAAAGDLDSETILGLRPVSYSTRYDGVIASAARRHQVDPLLLHAVIKQESGYRENATSHAGALGLMQVMPATGRDLGVANAAHLYDPAINVDTGAKLIRQLWHRMDGNVDLVLAAYNAGEGAVRKYGMLIPPYRETQDYVVKVKASYARLASESGVAVSFQ